MLSRSEEETIELGYELGRKLEKGMCLALKGDLAGGKTTFTKGIGKALNVKGIINSPTFTILKIYEGDLKLFHIDAYRLEGNEYDLGLDEYLDELTVFGEETETKTEPLAEIAYQPQTEETAAHPQKESVEDTQPKTKKWLGLFGVKKSEDEEVVETVEAEEVR